MIISDSELEQRLRNPMNLINQLRNTSRTDSSNGNSGRTNSRSSAMGLFGVNRGPVVQSPSEQSSATQSPTASTVNNPTAPIAAPSNIIPFNQPVVGSSGSSSSVPVTNPISSAEPSIDALLNNSDTQIKLSLAHDQALEVLTNSVRMLNNKLDSVHPSKLPSVITATSKVVDSIRRERNEAAKNGNDREVHYHFYTPVQRSLESYGEVIEVQ